MTSQTTRLLNARRGWVSFVFAVLLGTILPKNAQCGTDDSTLMLNSNNGTTQFSVQNSANADVFSVNSYGGVQISSNTVLPGTTFYQNGNAVITGNLTVGSLTNNGALANTGGNITLGGPGFQVLVASNTIMPGTTFYYGGPILMSNPLTVSNAATFGAPGSAVQITSNTVLSGATFYYGGPINFANALTVTSSATLGAAGQSVIIASNTILPGTTFYQNGNAVMTGNLTVGSLTANNGGLTATGGNTILGGPGFSVLVTSNTVLPGATFYYGGPINFANPLTVSNTVTLGTAGSAVTISSNVILTGTTFYQNGNAAIGTATSQIGFFGHAQVSQLANNSEIRADLINLGLVANGGNNTLTLPGLLTVNGGMTIADGTNIGFGTVTGTRIGTNTNQLIGFYGHAPATQPTASQDIVTNVLAGLGLMAAGGNPTLTLGSGNIVSAGAITTSGIFTQGSTGQFSVNTSGLATKYNNDSLQGNGLSSIPGFSSNSGQAIPLAATTLYTTPAAVTGLYQIVFYVVVTGAQSAHTVLPQLTWSDDNGTNTLATLPNTIASATVGTYAQNVFTFESTGSSLIRIGIGGTATTATVSYYAALIRLD